MLERLEQRKLLSASVSFEPSSGILYVYGTDNADRIEITVAPSKMPGYELHAERSITPVLLPVELVPEALRVEVKMNGQLKFMHHQSFESLRAIYVEARAGDDVVAVRNTGSMAQTLVFGEDGNDVITVTAIGGSPAGELFGGPGNDVIQANSVKGSTQGWHIQGGEGNDLIYGSDFRDELYGDLHTMAEFLPEEGDDTIYAGDGDDLIFGGGGNDFLYGEDGDDVIYGGEGFNYIDGGSGYDCAMYSPFDKMADIEELMYPDITK